MLGSLDFIKSVFTTFGMTYKLDLSTRPKKALGEKEIWDRAEAALARAMDNFAAEGGWKVNPGDGAFYGPKVDIKVMDAMEQIHQCATIQLDFQLPIRFNLHYNNGSKEEGNQFARPVIVHRAMLGHSGYRHMTTANKYGTRLHSEGFYADVYLSKNTFPKKVRAAQVE
jgi:threonyl-tRNA synthetase